MKNFFTFVLIVFLAIFLKGYNAVYGKNNKESYSVDNSSFAISRNEGIFPTSFYTTKELRPNIINGKNILDQKMINEKNTKYVIKCVFDLDGKTIKIPESSILVFDGGQVINGSIDFTCFNSPFIYSSWMDTETLLNSVRYMSYKTLIIDNVLAINRPISNKNADNLKYFTITGLFSNDHKWSDGNNKNHSHIICNNCVAIDIKGWCNVIKDLSFTFSKGGGDNPFIINDTQGQGVSDLDAIVDNCFFDTDDHRSLRAFTDIMISNAIVTYGRGLKVKDCVFNGPVKDAYVKCYMKTDTWRKVTGIDVSDKYGGRAFWFYHNRVHMGLARFVHFAVNDYSPDCVFRGIRIENNIADVGGSLGCFDAPTYDMVISNNTFLGGVHPSLSFLELTDANEVKIENNVFRAYDNEDLSNIQLRANYCISIHGKAEKEIKNISICNNLVSCNAYFVFADVGLNGIIINSNIFNEHSFTNDNCAILRSLKTTKNVIIANNINSSLKKKYIESFRAFDKSFPNENLSDVSITSNSGCINWVTSFGQYDRLLKGREFSNISIQYDSNTNPEEIMDKCSFIINVKSNIGFSYVDSTLNPVRPVIWNGFKWIEHDGASKGIKRSGTYNQKPDSSDIYIGFQYYCTDCRTNEGSTYGMSIIWNGKHWTDALGRIVH